MLPWQTIRGEWHGSGSGTHEVPWGVGKLSGTGQLGRDRLSGDVGSDYLLGGSGFDACSNGEVTARCELDSNQK